jgi:hypothetical protein
LAILSAVIEQSLSAWNPADFRSQEVWLVLSLGWTTLVAAIIAAVLGAITARLYGRFAAPAVLVALFPVLYTYWPWNSVYHDFPWSYGQWGIALYEWVIYPVLGIVAVIAAQKYVKRSDSALVRTRVR